MIYCLQIILIDDGSPDDCSKICDEWNEIDKRITVIHKPNGGLSDARNAGMKIVAGKYISFIDSDDMISREYFETMLAVMEKEQSEIVECSVVQFDEDNNINQYHDDNTIKSYVFFPPESRHDSICRLLFLGNIRVCEDLLF